MSKIGRKPIAYKNVAVEVKDHAIHYKGKKAAGVHVLPEILDVQLIDGTLKLTCAEKSRDANKIWGLHRALLANEIIGADVGFSEQVTITGLGFKGVVSGNKIDFSLGYSHKIPFLLPSGISVEVDKTGQLLTVKGSNKELVGLVCSQIRALRPPEPYKGTGIKVGNEVIRRKAGKTKSA